MHVLRGVYVGVADERTIEATMRMRTIELFCKAGDEASEGPGERRVGTGRGADVEKLLSAEVGTSTQC